VNAGGQVVPKQHWRVLFVTKLQLSPILARADAAIIADQTSAAASATVRDVYRAVVRHQRSHARAVRECRHTFQTLKKVVTIFRCSEIRHLELDDAIAKEPLVELR
jgi:hypothetical protein